MKISRLETFVKLAEVNSFSQVAEELKLTQPAVSIQVKNLEEFFGVQLVERGADGITLTPEGKLLYKEAKEIIRLWQNVRQKINQIKDLVKGELIIGASTIPAEYILPPLIVSFCNTYPLIELTMEVKDSGSIIQEILKKKCHLGVVGVNPEGEEFESIAVAADQLVLIVPTDHSLANKGVVSKKDILNNRFIIREKGSGTRKAMEDGLKGLDVKLEDLQIVAQLGSTEAVIAAVEAGLGISIISGLAVKGAEKMKRVRVVGIEGFQINRQFYLTYLKESYNPLVQKFIETFRLEFNGS